MKHVAQISNAIKPVNFQRCPWYKSGAADLPRSTFQGLTMNPSVISFLLVLLVEGIAVIASYLKERLMGNLDRSSDHGNNRSHDYA